jgi:C2H2-type zinc finger/Zinc finger, C2H2 type
VELTNHSRLNNQLPWYKCNSCERRYISIQTLKIHEKFHKTNKKLACHRCNKSYYNAYQLKVHVERHERYPDWCCRICSLIFTRKDLYLNHMFLRHERDDLFGFACEDCGRRCTTLSALDRHVKLFHRSDVVFRCTRCRAKFTSNQDLLTHLSRHEIYQQMPTCERCSKVYKSYVSLQTHRKFSHRQAVVFSCTFCGEGFESAGVLFDHLGVHEFEQYFVCQRCFQISSDSKAALQHLSYHYPERKSWKGYHAFLCIHCNKRYRDPSQTIMHGKLRHPTYPYTPGVVYIWMHLGRH